MNIRGVLRYWPRPHPRYPEVALWFISAFMRVVSLWGALDYAVGFSEGEPDVGSAVVSLFVWLFFFAVGRRVSRG